MHDSTSAYPLIFFSSVCFSFAFCNTHEAHRLWALKRGPTYTTASRGVRFNRSAGGGNARLCEFYTLVRGILAPHQRRTPEHTFSFLLELPAVLRSNGHRAFEPWRSARMCG